MELIDILNEQEEIIGIEPREKVHQQGLLHTTIHILTYNSKKEILLQKRAREKDFDAGKWDFILGGHLSSGENYEEAVLKELGEEYGIRTTLDKLKFLKSKRFLLNLPEQNWHDNEFNYIYFFKYSGDIKDLILQKEEVAEIRFISLNDLEKDISDHIKKLDYCSHGDYSYYFEMMECLRNIS